MLCSIWVCGFNIARRPNIPIAPSVRAAKAVGVSFFSAAFALLASARDFLKRISASAFLTDSMSFFNFLGKFCISSSTLFFILSSFARNEVSVWLNQSIFSLCSVRASPACPKIPWLSGSLLIFEPILEIRSRVVGLNLLTSSARSAALPLYFSILSGPVSKLLNLLTFLLI